MNCARGRRGSCCRGNHGGRAAAHGTLLAPGAADSYGVIANYYARVSYSDWVFGELLDGLEALGVMNRTAVAFSSDHGDFQGNYGLVRSRSSPAPHLAPLMYHDCSLPSFTSTASQVEKWSGAADDLLLRVPLVLRLPGGGAPRSIAAPVQLFDILPTFMELAGLSGWLSNPGNVTGYVQFGASLLPWTRGETPPPAGVHPYVYAGEQGRVPGGGATRAMLTLISPPAAPHAQRLATTGSTRSSTTTPRRTRRGRTRTSSTTRAARRSTSRRHTACDLSPCAMRRTSSSTARGGRCATRRAVSARGRHHTACVLRTHRDRLVSCTT